MTVEEVLQNLQTLYNQFISHNNNWVRLKNQQEFIFKVAHRSPIRKMCQEGGSCAFFLQGSLNTSDIHKSMLVDEYVMNVKRAILPEELYKSIGKAAQQDFETNYPANYTVQNMLRQYWDQWKTIKRVEQFLDDLIATSAYQPLDSLTPMGVIQQHVKHWEKNAQLHEGLDENQLRSQLVLALQNAGFNASAETHAYQGHADILVNKPSVRSGANNNFELVAECKIWRGHAAFHDALSQLCQYVTHYDNHAALIVFVNDGSFVDICKKAEQYLLGHPSCRNPSKVSADYIEYSLIPAQNQASEIPATLLLCNLTTPRYARRSAN